MSTVDLGDVVTITGTFETPPDEVIAEVRHQDATASTPLDTPTQVSPTVYQVSYQPELSGRWYFRMEGLGAVQAVQETSVYVLASQTDPSETTPIFETIRPDLQMVADLVRTRLVTEGGTQVTEDTFTDETYPNDRQVGRLIDQATVYIVAQLPGSVSEDFPPAAKHLCALYAAILVEASYFREQLTDDQVELYRNMLIAGIGGLSQATGSGTGGGTAGQRLRVDSIIQRSVMTDPYELVYQMGLPTNGG